MVTKILFNNNRKLLFVAVLMLAGVSAAVFANSPYDITFPIPELGNCASKSECRAYCDIAGASDVQKKLPKSEISQKQGDWIFQLRVFGGESRYQLVISNNNGIGPFSISQGDGTLYTAGNPLSCRGLQVYSTDQGRLPEQLPFSGVVTDCKTGEKTSFQIPTTAGGLSLTEKTERQNQCDAFAVKHNLGNAQERTQKLAAVEADGGPGGCARSENPYETCNIYCSLADHMEECVNYAKTHAGIMSEEELRDADKVTTALKSGAKLPDFCATDMRSCKDKCMAPANAEVARQCFTFAKAAGLAPQDVSADDMEKMFEIMKKRGLSFKDMSKCEEEASDVCIEVGTEAGLIKPAEVKMIKATGGKGPGGCRGREACASFCNNEVNQEVCGNFMSEVLDKNPDLNVEEFIPEADRARMQEGLGQMRSGLAQAPKGVKTCLEKTFPGIVSKVEAGSFSTAEMMKAGPKMGKVMQQCFQEAFSAGGFPGAPGEFPGSGQNSFPGGQGQFPGGEQDSFQKGPGGFPGKPGEFPGGQGHGGPNMGTGFKECFAELGIDFPPKRPLIGDQEAQMKSCMQKRFAPQNLEHGSEGLRPGDEAMPRGEFKTPAESGPNGFFNQEQMKQKFPGGSPGQEELQQLQKQQFNQQFNQEFQKQSQQEYQRQFQQIQGGGTSGGSTQPPQSQPPDQFRQQYQQQFQQGSPQQFPQQPSGGEFSPSGTQQFQQQPQQFQQPQSQPIQQQPVLQPQSRLSPPSLGDFLGNIIFGLLLPR